MRLRAFALVLGALASSACGPRTAVEEGARVVSDPRYSPSLYNFVACTSCHATGAVSPTEGPIYPGAPLAGALRRPNFWGGTVRTAADAVDLCYRRFMRGGPLDPALPESIALYAYLDTIAAQGSGETQAFTVPPMVMRLTGGDPTRGRVLYERACASCHGAVRTGEGRPRAERGLQASVVPQATEIEHNAAEGYDQAALETVFVQKVRHGSFLGYAGVMPPFSIEALPDAQLADIIAYLAPTLRAIAR